jgi:small subunit ribosomal protein S1
MTEELSPKPTSLEQLSPGMQLQGTIKRIELYGAFVDVGLGLDGLLHISQLGRPNVRNVEDVVQVGQTVAVYVLKADREARRLALSLERPPAVSWDSLQVGQTVRGKVAKIENFGAFIDIGAERLAMIHVSELASGFVKSPGDVVKLDEEVEAQIIKIDPRKKRIDLSIKALQQQEERAVAKAVRQQAQADEEELGTVPTALELAMRRAMEESGQAMPSGKGGRRDDRRGGKRDRRDRSSDDLEDIFERTLRGGHR